MPEPFDYDVFLSHSSVDLPRVRRLAEQLRDAGLRVWLDEWAVQAAVLGFLFAFGLQRGGEPPNDRGNGSPNHFRLPR